MFSLLRVFARCASASIGHRVFRRSLFPNACGALIRPGRVGAAAFLLAAAWAGRADAACGDWLAGHDAMPAEAVFDHDDAPRQPCNGPQCRRSRHDLPIAPTEPTRSFDQSDRWCQLVEALTGRPPLSSPLPAEAAPVVPDGVRPSIERPPRV